MTINIFDMDTFSLKCVLNPNLELFIKCLALNQKNLNELAVYYNDEIMFFDISTEKLIDKIKIPEPKYIQYNKDGKLLIVTKKEDLIYLDLSKKKIENIKFPGKAVLAKWNPKNV